MSYVFDEYFFAIILDENWNESIRYGWNERF